MLCTTLVTLKIATLETRQSRSLAFCASSKTQRPHHPPLKAQCKQSTPRRAPRDMKGRALMLSSSVYWTPPVGAPHRLRVYERKQFFVHSWSVGAAQHKFNSHRVCEGWPWGRRTWPAAAQPLPNHHSRCKCDKLRRCAQLAMHACARHTPTRATVGVRASRPTPLRRQQHPLVRGVCKARRARGAGEATISEITRKGGEGG
jgi:hypothetical protein